MILLSTLVSSTKDTELRAPRLATKGVSIQVPGRPDSEPVPGRPDALAKRGCARRRERGWSSATTNRGALG